MTRTRRSPTEGTIFEDKNRPGRWIVEVSLGKRPDGGRHRVRRYCRSKSEALHVKRTLVADATAAARIPQQEDSPTLRDVLTHYLTHETEGLKDRSRAWYGWMVEHYTADDLLESRVTEITTARLDSWLEGMVGRYSRRTRLQSRKLLNLVLRDAVRRRLIDENPLDRAHTIPRTRDAEVNPDQVYSVREVLDLLEKTKDHSLGPMISLGVALGLRRGELHGLQWQDLDLDAQPATLKVRRSIATVRGRRTPDRARIDVGDVKTRESRRALPLDPGLVATLKRVWIEQERRREEAGDYWFNASGYVFTDAHGLPLDPCSTSKTFHRLLERNGLRVIPLHGLRHTAACLMLEAGVPLVEVSQMLGHTSMDFTKRYYARYVQALADRATTALSDLLRAGATARAIG